MNIWNKVLVGLILVMALPFCYFAAKALDVRKKAGEAIAKSEKELASLTADKEKLLRGPGGIAELRAEVFPYINRRGRVWIGVTRKQFARDTGNVMVQTTAAPPKDAPGAVQLYVFQDSIPSQEKQEDQEKAAKVDAAPGTPAGYLGEFTIANVAADGKTWQLAPVRPIPEERLARIENGRGTWTIYETMPIPDPDLHLVARAAVPAATEPGAEPAKSASEAPKKLETADDAKAFAAKLVDYGWLFNELYATRTVLLERKAAAEADLKSLTDSVALEDQANTSLSKQIETLTAGLAAKEKQRDLVQAHQKAIEARLSEISGGVEELMKTNRQIAAEIAKLQLDAARRIDQRVRGVVQTAAAR